MEKSTDLQVKETKQEIRVQMWKLLEQKKVARFPLPLHDRIPNFEGAEKPAQVLQKWSKWKAAKVIKINPDAPQRHVRYNALIEGKLIYMAIPQLKQEKCFIELDPRNLKGKEWEASTIRGAFRYGNFVRPSEMKHIDIFVAGSVAVNRNGVRLGKGGGFSDLEYAIGFNFGIITESTITLTTVHELQIIDEQIPILKHDFYLDYIVTANKLLYTTNHYKFSTIFWDDLDIEKINQIPLLKKLMLQKKEKK